MTIYQTFRDFKLELRNYDFAAGNYEVAVLPDDRRDALAGIRIELKGAEVEDRLSDLEAKQIEFEDLLILGKALADRLLPEKDGIRSSFIKFVDETIAEGKRVRLRLIIRDIGLQLIPWEYPWLKLSDAGRDINHFLCLNPLISLVRHLPLGKELPELAPKDARKVSVMAVMANPQFPGLPDLDLEAERRVLEGIFDEVSKGDQMIDWQPFNGENHLSKGDVTPVMDTRCSKVLSLSRKRGTRSCQSCKRPSVICSTSSSRSSRLQWVEWLLLLWLQSSPTPVDSACFLSPGTALSRHAARSATRES